MNPRQAADVISRGMRFHRGLGRFGYLGDTVNMDPGFNFGPVSYDPSQLPYIPSPSLTAVGAPAPVPVSAQVSGAIVQSSAWPSWGTYAAIGAGVLAIVWLSKRR